MFGSLKKKEREHIKIIYYRNDFYIFTTFFLKLQPHFLSIFSLQISYFFNQEEVILLSICFFEKKNNIIDSNL